MQGNLAAQAMLKPPDATGYNIEAQDEESFGDDADQQQMLSPGEQRAMNEQFLGQPIGQVDFDKAYMMVSIFWSLKIRWNSRKVY